MVISQRPASQHARRTKQPTVEPQQIRLPRDQLPSAVVHPLRPGRPLSDMTLRKILRDRGLAARATVRGFRSAFRDWCAETGKPREIAEAALAHTVGGVEGAYFRSDLLARRRVLMGQWASFLTGDESKVVQLYG